MPSTIHRRALLSAAAAGTLGSFAVRAAAEPAAGVKTPSSAMPPIAAFAQTPVVDQIALSPDGKRCAIVTQTGDEKALMVMTIGSADKPKLIPLGPDKSRGLLWADNGNLVLTDSRTAALDWGPSIGPKHEYWTAHVINADTPHLQTLFDKEPGFYSIITGQLGRIRTASGYRIIAGNVHINADWLVNPKKPYAYCLYSFSPEGRDGHLLCGGTPDTDDWVVTPEGHVVAMSEFDEDTKDWTLSMNLSEPGKTARFKPVYKTRSALHSPDLIGLGRDGKSAVVRLNEGFEYGRYHEVSVDGTLSDPIDAANEDRPRSALFHPVTGRLAGFSRHDDWFVYDYFDPLMTKLNAAVSQVMGPQYRVSHAGYAEDPRKMILYGESATDAGSYVFSDFSTGAMVALDDNYPDLPEEWITQKQPIRYKAADGLEIHGYLTLPPFREAANLPLVVLPHGGPQARDYIDFDWQVQTLASRGYAVLQPNFRGSDGYGVQFTNAGHGEWGGKMQTDLSDGVRFLANKGLVDPKRVAIMGASYGGYAALAGATLDPGVYNCSVSIAGPSDMKAFTDFVTFRTGSHQSTAVLYWKDFLGDKARYDAISPAKQAAKASCPVLLIHGTDDTVVSIEQSRMMERALKAAGKPVDFITFKGQDHWETIASTRLSMMQAAVDFLAKHNPA